MDRSLEKRLSVGDVVDVVGGVYAGAHGSIVIDDEDHQQCCNFEVVLTKEDGRKLGLSIDLDDEDDHTLLIHSVHKDGLLYQQQDEQSRCLVEPGDRILEINGIRGSAEKLFNESRKNGRMHLTVRRVETTPYAIGLEDHSVTGFVAARHIEFHAAKGGIETQSGTKLQQIASSLGLPDAHLLLGVTKQTVLDFAQNIGFSQYNRTDAFMAMGKADWITPAHGAEPTGYDFCVCIRSWLKATGKELLSPAEVLLSEGNLGAGQAVRFLSHVQSEPLESTLSIIQLDETRWWIDYMILRQCQSDFVPVYIQAVIESISDTLAKEDEAQHYFCRAFCIMEIAATPDYCLELPVCEARQKQIRGFGKDSQIIYIQVDEAGRGWITIEESIDISVGSAVEIRDEGGNRVGEGIASFWVEGTDVGGTLLKLRYGEKGSKLKGGQVMACLKVGMRVVAVLPFEKRAGDRIDSENAQASKQSDKNRVDEFILKQGGFERINHRVANAMQYAFANRHR